MSSSSEEDTKPSGKELRQSSSKPTTEERQLDEAITNANVVDINTSTSTSTGGQNPNVDNSLNPADNFKKGQVLVNDKGEEI